MEGRPRRRDQGRRCRARRRDRQGRTRRRIGARWRDAGNRRGRRRDGPGRNGAGAIHSPEADARPEETGSAHPIAAAVEAAPRGATEPSAPAIEPPAARRLSEAPGSSPHRSPASRQPRRVSTSRQSSEAGRAAASRPPMREALPRRRYPMSAPARPPARRPLAGAARLRRGPRWHDGCRNRSTAYRISILRRRLRSRRSKWTARPETAGTFGDI